MSLQENLVGQRLKELRLKNHMEQTDVAHAMGYKSFTTISKWENGKNLPNGGKLAKLATLFNTTTDYILHGEMPKTTPQITQEAPDELLEELTANYTRLDLKRRERLVVASSELVKEQIEEQTDIADNIIPFRAEKLFDYEYYDQAASAGTGQYLGDVAKETIQLPIEVDADFVIPIHGDSMEPDYHEGDLIFVELTLNLNDGDIGIFSLDGDVYIKQLLIKENNKAYLHSLNSKYADIPITTNSDFRVIGEVVKSYREK